MTCSHACPRFESALRLHKACRLLHVFAGVLCALLLSSGTALAQAQAPDQAVDAQRLLIAFSAMPGLQASFVEEKHIAMLAKPLESRGELYFTKPGLLLRRVTSPRASEVLITPSSVRLKDDSGEKAIDLATRADLRPFIESLVWILAGERSKLEQVYTITFAPEREGEPWQLTLAPREGALKQIIEHIRIRGRGLRVAEIHVQETGGDRTVTRILDANPARTFSAAERRALFGDDGQR